MIENISLAGSEAVVAMLKALPDKIRTKVEREAIVKANKLLSGKIRSEAPRDSGALKRSVGAVVRKYDNGKIIVGVIGPRSDFAGNVVVKGKRKKRKTFKKGGFGSKKTFRRPAKYAHMVEGGTKRGAKPNPFMQRSIEAVRGQIIRIFEDTVREAVEQS